MTLGHKTYNYDEPVFTCYYLTINGIQFGSVLFSLKEVEEAKRKFNEIPHSAE